MNKNYKLPYIPDKKLYAAVMGACSYVRDTGYFHKACEYYADRYDVDVEDVEKYVRIAQGNGQKRANANRPKRKYYWFAVEYSMGNDRIGCNYFEPTFAQYEVAKGLRADTVMCRLSASDDECNENLPCHWFGRVEPFDTKEEAIKCVKKWKLENTRNE